MRTICEPCGRGEHGYCSPIPDPDRECCFLDCKCLHDPVVVRRDARITALLVEAQADFARGDDAAMCVALRRILAEAEPHKSQRGAAAKPMRRMALVGTRQPTTADCYVQASGEPIEPWMQVKHDGEKR